MKLKALNRSSPSLPIVCGPAGASRPRCDPWQPAVLESSGGFSCFYCFGAAFRFRKSWAECCSCCLLARGRLFLSLPYRRRCRFSSVGFYGYGRRLKRASVILLKLANANLLLTYLLSVTPLFVLLELRSVGVPAILLEL